MSYINTSISITAQQAAEYMHQKMLEHYAKQSALIPNPYAGGLNQAAQTQSAYISTTTPTPPNKVLLLCQ